MPKYYVKWQLETTKIPADYQEMVKSRLARGEMIKADIKAGIIKDWGCAAGGYFGYLISEGIGEAELLKSLLKYMPYVYFEVVPVLSIDQTIESIKKAAPPAMKK